MGWGRPPLASGALDRDAETRADAGLLRAAWSDPAARVLRLRGTDVPVVEAAGVTRLALVPTRGEFTLSWNGRDARHVYLGRAQGAPVFAVSASADGTEHGDGSAENTGGVDTVEADTAGGDIVEGERWAHAFAVGGDLGPTDREVLAVASGLLRWHESSQFSPRDGGDTHPVLGGWARHDAHGGEHFPRTDPAVIVLVEHEDRVLLGSNALWESGRFSLLAGFVEAGESLEQTVLREVFEESGARLGEIEYVGSQPWPFPRSLMLGFRARLAPGADPADLRPDPEEISELRWFTRDEVRDPAPGIVLPGGLSIARWMLDSWCAESDRGGEQR